MFDIVFVLLITLLIGFIFWMFHLKHKAFLKRTRPIMGISTIYIEGERVEKPYVKYRQNLKTGLVLHFMWDSGGGQWYSYGPEESEVILRKEKEGKIK